MSKLVAKKKPKDLWVLERDGVTYSFLERLLTCPEKAHLSYRKGLSVPYFRGAIKFGNIIHAVLDHTYTEFKHTVGKFKPLEVFPKYLQRDEQATKEELQEVGYESGTEEELEELYGTAEALLGAYFRYWTGDFINKRWEALEEEFSVPYTIRSGEGPIEVQLRGKIDARYRAKNKRVWIMDTKTKSQIQEGNLLDRLSFDLQSMIYTVATREMIGELPAGMLYNVMRRPQLRRSAKETLKQFIERVREDIEKRTDWYFYRFEAAYTPADLERWEREFDSIMRLVYAWSRGTYGFRFSSACESKYGVCEFLPYCARGDAGRLTKRGNVFPELVQLST